MKKQDIDFLKDLQHEMLTQDTVCQANPRFWVVRHKVRTYGLDREYGYDGTEVVYEGERLAENLLELYEYLKENEEDLEIEYGDNGIFADECVFIDKDTDGEQCIYNLEELVDFMIKELDYNDGLHAVDYKEEYVIAPDTMFLTKRECEEHIKKNHYHYNEPHSYAMTAWRSPQVEKLFDVIMNTNWNLCKDLED